MKIFPEANSCESLWTEIMFSTLGKEAWRYGMYFFNVYICVSTLEHINTAHVIGSRWWGFFSYHGPDILLRWCTILCAGCSGSLRKWGVELFIILYEWQRDICLQCWNIWDMCLLLYSMLSSNVLYNLFTLKMLLLVAMDSTFSCIISLHSLDDF